MRWFDLRTWATCGLLLTACSDDGLSPANGDTDTGAGVSASAGGTGDSGAGTSAVTTADPSTASDSDTEGQTTDPTGVSTDTDSGGSTSGDSDGSSGGSSGGSGDSSGTSGGATEPECTVDDDCMLVDDCCSCDAIPVGDPQPKCDMLECLVPTCQSLGLGVPAVQCNFGTCEVEEVSCNPLAVSCDAPPPKCPDGQVPRVMDGCWGTCIPVEFCDVVPGCEDCQEHEACVEAVTQLGPSFSCVPIAPECDGVPSCDCLGEACEAPFDVCADGIEPKSGSEISCSCPAC